MESVSRLSLVGLYLSAGLSLIKLALGITLDASREKTGLSTFIGKYGNPLTEKYQLALKFIIKTGTPSIIQLKTLILSLKKIMRMNIEKRDQLGLALKNIWQHLKESGPSLKSGMLPKKEESGTPSTLLKILKKRNILPINASNVNRTSRVGPFKKTKSYFVQIIASHGGEDCLVSTMKLEAALLVVRILSVIDTQEKKTVHAIVLKRNIGKTKVYDLMVADRHEYRANGLLVHNCLDLTRYVLNLANYYTIEDAKPIDFKVKYEKGTFEQDEYRQRPEEGYGSFDLD
jgi:intein/homing endonuclease